MITVSVIMTTYGQDKFIAQAINGVLLQECDFNIEVIVADDNSPDNTENVVKSLVENHPKKDWVKYTKHKVNKGMMVNGMWALNQCLGKYIALCEGDDYWTDPLKLQKQVDFLEANEEYGLVFTDFDIYYDESKVYRRNIFKNKLMPLYYTFEEHLLHAGFLAPCTWLCRKELVPHIKSDCVDGSYFWMLHVMTNSKIKFLNDTTTVYRVLNESASRSNSLQKRFDFSFGVFEIQQDFMHKFKISKTSRDLIFRQNYKKLFPIAYILKKNIIVKKANIFWKLDKRNFLEYIFYFFSASYIFRPFFKTIYFSRLFLIQNLNFKTNKNQVWKTPKL
tara:strand:+ start:42819 stop:43820 length:1002 start_codon:yes stop_codon:yes gene_type:complete